QVFCLGERVFRISALLAAEEVISGLGMGGACVFQPCERKERDQASRALVNVLSERYAFIVAVLACLPDKLHAGVKDLLIAGRNSHTSQKGVIRILHFASVQ